MCGAWPLTGCLLHLKTNYRLTVSSNSLNITGPSLYFSVLAVCFSLLKIGICGFEDQNKNGGGLPQESVKTFLLRSASELLFEKLERWPFSNKKKKKKKMAAAPQAVSGLTLAEMEDGRYACCVAAPCDSRLPDVWADSRFPVDERHRSALCHVTEAQLLVRFREREPFKHHVFIGL